MPDTRWIIFEVSVPCPHFRHTPEQPPKVKPGAEKAEKAPVKRRPVLEKTLLDQDVEYLFEKSDQDADLDEQLKEDLRKKKSDPRYIEMQVLSQVKEKIDTTLSEKKSPSAFTGCVSRTGIKKADCQ